MSIAQSEHFEDDTLCVKCLKDHSDVILKQEPIKVFIFFDNFHFFFLMVYNCHWLLELHICTDFLNLFDSVSQILIQYYLILECLCYLKI